MKRLSIIAILAAFASLVTAQSDQPIELPEHRKPSVVTNGNCLIKNVKIITVTKGDIARGDILVRDGKIVEIGRNLSAPEGFAVIDATGKTLMPGIVDTHSHRGIDGTNEGSESIVAEVRMADVINSTALSIWQVLASGHTSGLLLHGSANAVGGESVVVKYKYNRPTKELRVPDAPRMIKFALGENVTRKSSDEQTRFPMSRMGVEAVYRRAFEEAKQYRAKKNAGENIQTDIRLETLADILDRKIWVHCHSYRADEMLMMVRLSQEFGFKIGAMQHALEAYKIAPEMAAAGVGAGMFADNWGYKIEAYQAIPFNAAISRAAGVLVSINTDGLSGTSALNIDAAKAMRFGGVSPNEALKMLTINPAIQLGIDHRTGSIEVGKDADFGIWDGHPLSVYARPWMTIVEGEVYYQRRDAWNVDSISTTKHELDDFTYTEDTPLPKKSDVYAITGATLHTVTNGVIENGTIIVTHGKITAIGKGVNVPRGAEKIDGRGKHVYPGFIDGGTTIGLSEISGILQTNDSRELGTHQPDLDAATALFVENVYMGTARFTGVTHSFSRPAFGTISGQGAFIQHDGYTTEQIALKRKAALVVNFPNVSTYKDLWMLNNLCCAVDDFASVGMEWLDGFVDPKMLRNHSHEAGKSKLLLAQDEEDDLPSRVQALDDYFNSVHEYIDNGRSPRNVQMEAMIPYVKGEKPVLMRVRTASTIRAAVDFAKRNKLKVILAGAADAWREAELLARENIPVLIPPAGKSTLGANSTTQSHDPYDTPYVVPYLLAKAGVKFGFEGGSNAMAQNLPFKVGMSCAYGLSIEDAIKALTIWPAEIFGVDDQIGSLEVGKSADFFITDGDPFELTTNMHNLFIGGKPVALESQHTRLRDKYWGRFRN